MPPLPSLPFLALVLSVVAYVADSQGHYVMIRSTCEGMEESLEGLPCTVNPGCFSAQCEFDIPGSPITISASLTIVQACSPTPSIRVDITAAGFSLVEITVDHTTTIPIEVFGQNAGSATITLLKVTEGIKLQIDLNIDFSLPWPLGSIVFHNTLLPMITLPVDFTPCTVTQPPTTSTEAVTTEVATTEAEVATTEAVTTEVATTEAVTTEVATTEAVTTEVATTEAVTTEVATTEAVTTEMTTTEATTTMQTTATTPSQHQSPETCQALQDATSGSGLLTGCTTNTGCTAVMCSVPSVSLTLTLILLPCNTPISMQLLVVDSSGMEIGNEVVDKPETISIGNGVDAEITLDQVDGGIQIQINVITLLGSTVLVGNTVIPVDTSCQGIATQSPTTEVATFTAQTTVQSMTTLVQPTTAIPYATMMPTIPSPTATTDSETPSGSFKTMCEALRDVVANSQEVLAEINLNGVIMCSTNRPADCDGIDCSSAILGTMSVTLLQCEEPFAIKFEFIAPNGEVDNRIFTTSVITSDNPVAGTIVLNITLNQFPDAIGLEVTAQSAISTSGPVVPIVQYTVIPLEKDKCEKFNSEDDKISSGKHTSVSTTVFTAFLCITLLAIALLN